MQLCLPGCCTQLWSEAPLPARSWGIFSWNDPKMLGTVEILLSPASYNKWYSMWCKMDLNQYTKRSNIKNMSPNSFFHVTAFWRVTYVWKHILKVPTASRFPANVGTYLSNYMPLYTTQRDVNTLCYDIPKSFHTCLKIFTEFLSSLHFYLILGTGICQDGYVRSVLVHLSQRVTWTRWLWWCHLQTSHEWLLKSHSAKLHTTVKAKKHKYQPHIMTWTFRGGNFTSPQTECTDKTEQIVTGLYTYDTILVREKTPFKEVPWIKPLQILSCYTILSHMLPCTLLCHLAILFAKILLLMTIWKLFLATSTLGLDLLTDARGCCRGK